MEGSLRSMRGQRCKQNRSFVTPSSFSPYYYNVAHSLRHKFLDLELETDRPKCVGILVSGTTNFQILSLLDYLQVWENENFGPVFWVSLLENA
jgi:hypothetical protein